MKDNLAFRKSKEKDKILLMGLSRITDPNVNEHFRERQMNILEV